MRIKVFIPVILWNSLSKISWQLKAYEKPASTLTQHRTLYTILQINPNAPSFKEFGFSFVTNFLILYPNSKGKIQG